MDERGTTRTSAQYTRAQGIMDQSKVSVLGGRIVSELALNGLGSRIIRGVWEDV